MKQPHILCSEKDITEMVLLPGDPQRVLRAAKQLDSWEEVALNREYRVIKGKYKEMPVTVISTGMGGVSAAIALEELIACGGKCFIRIGSSGAVQKGIGIGDLIIPTAAVREDGTSKMYVEENYPAVCDFELTRAIIETCKRLKYNYFTGIIRSHDSFYTDREEELMTYWNKKGVIASDMETAPLLTVGSLRGVQVACILNNVVEYEEDLKDGINDYVDEASKAEEGERKEIKLALEAFYEIYKEKLHK